MGSDIPSLIAKFLLNNCKENETAKKQLILARLFCQRYDAFDHIDYIAPPNHSIINILDYLEKYEDDNYGKGSLSLELVLKNHRPPMEGLESLTNTIKERVKDKKLNSETGDTVINSLNEQSSPFKVWYVKNVKPYRRFWNNKTTNNQNKEHLLHMYSRCRVVFQYDHVYSIQVTLEHNNDLRTVYFATNDRLNSDQDVQTVYGVLLYILYFDTKKKDIFEHLIDENVFSIIENPNVKNLDNIKCIRIGVPSVVLGDFKSLWLNYVPI